MAADGGGRPTLRRPEVYAARRLRAEMTLPEVLLWKALKSGYFSFRKQHPIGPYIVDFYCAAARLVIEVDGKAHDMGDCPQRDAQRDTFLQREGYTIVRVLAADVLRDAGSVAASVVAAARPLRRPLRGRHLPVNGEDRENPPRSRGGGSEADGGGSSAPQPTIDRDA